MRVTFTKKFLSYNPGDNVNIPDDIAKEAIVKGAATAETTEEAQARQSAAHRAGKDKGAGVAKEAVTSPTAAVESLVSAPVEQKPEEKRANTPSRLATPNRPTSPPERRVDPVPPGRGPRAEGVGDKDPHSPTTPTPVSPPGDKKP